MPAYLDSIIAAHRASLAADRRPTDSLLERAMGMPAPRPFGAAVVKGASVDGLAVISEIKRRSPSKGDLDLTLNPSSVAAEYEAGGASCLSVLTDEQFFGGSAKDLHVAREACSLPVLRKDFTVSSNDVCDARLMGADAVLLIVAALAPQELTDLLSLAARLSLDALVEVHDAEELHRALDTGARLVGVNQRDLRTFAVNEQLALDLAADLPAAVVAIAESGIRTPADASRLASAGYHGVLVGESLVRSGDRRSAVADLVGSAR